MWGKKEKVEIVPGSAVCVRLPLTCSQIFCTARWGTLHPTDDTVYICFCWRIFHRNHSSAFKGTTPLGVVGVRNISLQDHLDQCLTFISYHVRL
jgi:hypothetical protein